MGKAAQTGAGAIYRYFKGELRKLISNITISNAICFSPNGDAAYFADTSQQIIHRWRLSAKDGWPIGDPEPFIDLRADNIHPDGAVVDQSGCLWNAQWGSGRVARYSPEGVYLDHIQCPASQSSCPAFGGETLTSLFVTSAAVGVNEPQAGQTFFVKDVDVKGQAEHQVLL
jgi:sugar lactone lactonase YvrE